jgi:hypothetical protein
MSKLTRLAVAIVLLCAACTSGPPPAYLGPQSDVVVKMASVRGDECHGFVGQGYKYPVEIWAVPEHDGRGGVIVRLTGRHLLEGMRPSAVPPKDLTWIVTYPVQEFKDGRLFMRTQGGVQYIFTVDGTSLSGVQIARWQRLYELKITCRLAGKIPW